MTIRSALAVLVGTTLLLGALGAGVGFGLGQFNPGYYRSNFRNGSQPGFDPVAVGVGQGLTQGTAGGVVVGVALIAVLCWRDTRLQRESGTPTAASDRRNSVTFRLLLVAGSLLALGISASGGFVMGALIGEQSAYNRECARQNRALASVLASDVAFKEVLIDECCCDAGWVILTGRVETKADLHRLEERTARAIGEERAKYAVSSVQVKEEAIKPGTAPESR